MIKITSSGATILLDMSDVSGGVHSVDINYGRGKYNVSKLGMNIFSDKEYVILKNLTHEYALPHTDVSIPEHTDADDLRSKINEMLNS